MGLLLALFYLSFLGMLWMVYTKMPTIRMQEGVPLRARSGADQLAEFFDRKTRSWVGFVGKYITPILRELNAWAHHLSYHAAEKTGRHLTRLSRAIKGRSVMRDDRGSLSLFLRNLGEKREH